MFYLQRDDKTVFPKFSECLKIYINVIKSTFPDVHVGLSFLASFFVDYYNNPLASCKYLLFIKY